MKAALLPDRGVVKVTGEDARKFLNGLVSNDMGKVSPTTARYAALLTPQGKIIVDFIVAEASLEDGGGFFLDCPRALAPALVEKLNFYKLRATVPAEEAYGELLEGLQAASTMPDLQAWRQRAACVDRCMMEFAPSASAVARDGCKAGCTGGTPKK